jgi:hypothetical protein
MTWSYMHLVFGRQRFYAASSAGKVTRIPAATNEEEALVEHHASLHTARADHARSMHDEWQSRLTELTDETKVVKITRKEGSFGSRIEKVVAVLTFPDGSTKEGPTAEVPTMLYEQCVQLHGDEPHVPTQDEDYETWLAETGAVGIEQRVWIGIEIEPDGSEREFEDGLEDWRFGAPLAGINHELNRLAADGWVVVSVSEDKGLYLGSDSRDESYPARIRYLLGREDADAAALDGTAGVVEVVDGAAAN